MIDLADAYRRVDGILAARGLSEARYAIGVEVWNHRGDTPPSVTYSMWARGEAWSRGILSGDCATIDAALAVFTNRLTAMFPGLPAEPITDLRVVLPAEIAEAAEAASQPF